MYKVQETFSLLRVVSSAYKIQIRGSPSPFLSFVSFSSPKTLGDPGDPLNLRLSRSGQVSKIPNPRLSNKGLWLQLSVNVEAVISAWKTKVKANRKWQGILGVIPW